MVMAWHGDDGDGGGCVVGGMGDSDGAPLVQIRSGRWKLCPSKSNKTSD